MKTYELPLSRDYVRSWGLNEAIRELVQNALDSESPFEWNYDEEMQTLSIQSRFATLPVKSLLLGVTTKADNNEQIGSFGEGYKLALLVLTRTDHPVDVHNDGLLWRPYFDISKQFDHETLHIREQRARTPPDGVKFVIQNIFKEDMVEIQKLCLQMQSKGAIGKFFPTPLGQILLDKPGALYVGGLYITTDTNFKFGYNFNPDQVTLERDRQTINGWDLYNATKNLWFASNKMDKVVELIDAGVNDLYYAHHGTPEVIKEAVFAAFKAKHPMGIPVKNKDELAAYIQRGLTNVIYVTEQQHSILMQDGEIKENATKQLNMPAPYDVLTQWLNEIRKGSWSADDHESFNVVLETAKHWRAK